MSIFAIDEALKFWLESRESRERTITVILAAGLKWGVGGGEGLPVAMVAGALGDVIMTAELGWVFPLSCVTCLAVCLSTKLPPPLTHSHSLEKQLCSAPPASCTACNCANNYQATTVRAFPVFTAGAMGLDKVQQSSTKSDKSDELDELDETDEIDEKRRGCSLAARLQRTPAVANNGSEESNTQLL